MTTIEKKYRIAKYDGSDTLFAKEMKNSFLYNTTETQAKFNEFTEQLMEDAQISRFKLLDAIDDYDRSEYSKRCPLTDGFKNNAWNFRPHQGYLM